MEPITLCGAVIVAFGLWVEFESIIMKVVRTISSSTIVAALMSSTKVQKTGRFISPNGYRSYRTGTSLSCRMARS
jgi:hypothetical protein